MFDSNVSSWRLARLSADFPLQRLGTVHQLELYVLYKRSTVAFWILTDCAFEIGSGGSLDFQQDVLSPDSKVASRALEWLSDPADLMLFFISIERTAIAQGFRCCPRCCSRFC